MATVVVNDGVQEHQIYDARQVSVGTSTVALSGGFMFYSNSPETLRGTNDLGDQGFWLNSDTVTGVGQIYTWHYNQTGSTINNALRVKNNNSCPIRITRSS